MHSDALTYIHVCTYVLAMTLETNMHVFLNRLALFLSLLLLIWHNYTHAHTLMSMYRLYIHMPLYKLAQLYTHAYVPCAD